MKNKLLLSLVALVSLFSIIFTGCAASGVAQEKYDQVVAQLADAQSQLTQAQNDFSALQSQKSAVDSDLRAAQTQITDLEQQVTDLQEQYEYEGLSTRDMLAQLVYNYKASHYYESGVYDCNNMASDIWSMLQAMDINSVIVVGHNEHLITNILESNHAWVLVQLTPGEYLALDGTNGRTYTQSSGSLYFHGWSFATPADLKANDDLKTEYNARVSFINTLTAAVNEAMTLYNNSANQAEADKWFALYNKLKELKTNQETLATSLMNQINQLATPLSL
jgi:outer membrane murein-binding lipoprotein Lpp